MGGAVRGKVGKQASPEALPGAFKSIAGPSMGVSSTSKSSALHWVITELRYTWGREGTSTAGEALRPSPSHKLFDAGSVARGWGG